MYQRINGVAIKKRHQSARKAAAWQPMWRLAINGLALGIAVAIENINVNQLAWQQPWPMAGCSKWPGVKAAKERKRSSIRSGIMRRRRPAGGGVINRLRSGWPVFNGGEGGVRNQLCNAGWRLVSRRG
jgi:hypothetical protein